jgi:hypothetical protein
VPDRPSGTEYATVIALVVAGAVNSTYWPPLSVTACRFEASAASVPCA